MPNDLGLSPDIEKRLFAFAEETGLDAVQIMRLVVSQFVEHEIPKSGEPEWTDARNQRRCQLIEKNASGDISVEERVELLSLQKRAERYFDRVAGPDVESAEKLLTDLLGKVKAANGNE